MEIFSRLPFRIKKSISKSKESKVPYPLSNYHCKTTRSTWRTAAVNKLKHYLNRHFLKLINCGRFPYQEKNVGNWFKLDIPQPEDKSNMRPINILNLGRRPGNIRQYPQINTTDFISNLEEDGYSIFYHGTNHESAKDIIEKGICLDKLKSRRQDFSCGSGFYLTDKFEGPLSTGALDWSFHRHHKNQAVLIFKIPNSEIDGYREGSKSLDDERELIEFVRKFRFTKPMDKRSLESELKDVSFVEGRCVKVECKCIKSSIEGSYQICLHIDDLTELFDKHLNSAIFFDTQKSSTTGAIP